MQRSVEWLDYTDYAVHGSYQSVGAAALALGLSSEAIEACCSSKTDAIDEGNGYRFRWKQELSPPALAQVPAPAPTPRRRFCLGSDDDDDATAPAPIPAPAP